MSELAIPGLPVKLPLPALAAAGAAGGYAIGRLLTGASPAAGPSTPATPAVADSSAAGTTADLWDSFGSAGISFGDASSGPGTLNGVNPYGSGQGAGAGSVGDGSDWLDGGDDGSGGGGGGSGSGSGSTGGGSTGGGTTGGGTTGGGTVAPPANQPAAKPAGAVYLATTAPANGMRSFHVSGSSITGITSFTAAAQTFYLGKAANYVTTAAFTLQDGTKVAKGTTFTLAKVLNGVWAGRYYSVKAGNMSLRAA